MKDRNATIYEMRQEGYTLAAIGQRYGIGKERVRQICLHQERLEEKQTFVNRQGTRQTVDSIKREIYILERFEDGRYTGGDSYKPTEAQKEIIKERFYYLEEYKKIIAE